MTKKELRKVFLAKRMGLTTAEITQKSEDIGVQLLQMPQFLAATAIHTFLPIATKNEIDTFAIIKKIQHHFPQKQIFVPRIVPNTNDLIHILIEPQTQFQLDKWGIPEPVVGNTTPHTSHLTPNTQHLTPNTSHLAFILIPLLAYDQHGHRVGYGKGFYDKFLAHCSPSTFKIGLSFFEPSEDIEDTNEHDIRLNACITPIKIWKF
jgi:5-formyltetrahydrofolate cyclo-ligase